jgi:hypothetical protein
MRLRPTPATQLSAYGLLPLAGSVVLFCVAWSERRR